MRSKSLGTFAVLIMALVCVASARAEVKDVMDQLLEQIFVLKPLMASEARFEDPANAGQISGALNNMVALSRQVNHEERIKQTGFQVSGSILTQQLEEVEDVFRNGNKEYARTNLRSTLSVCMSCHTQLPAVSTRFTDQNKTEVLPNPIEEAEFLFLIRNFDAAMTLYAELIQGFGDNGADPRDLEIALYRQIYYYVRVARYLKGLSIALRRDRENKQLPQRLQDQIDGFIAAVDAVKGAGYPQFTEAQVSQLQSYAQQQLGANVDGDFSLDSPENVIAALKFSSVLYEYLNENPQTPLKPDIFYWLSFGERRYLYQSMHSLPALYLKQCVLDYPKNPVAKQCLAEYEDIITVSFTGSGGTFIPDDVAQELDTMRRLVEAR